MKARLDPSAHAELEAIRSAYKSLGSLELSECTLYTNVEPCWMCSYAIRQTRLKRLVIGRRNESIGGFCSGFRVLLDENLRMPFPSVEFLDSDWRS